MIQDRTPLHQTGEAANKTACCMNREFGVPYPEDHPRGKTDAKLAKHPMLAKRCCTIALNNSSSEDALTPDLFRTNCSFYCGVTSPALWGAGDILIIAPDYFAANQQTNNRNILS